MDSLFPCWHNPVRIVLVVAVPAPIVEVQVPRVRGRSLGARPHVGIGSKTVNSNPAIMIS